MSAHVGTCRHRLWTLEHCDFTMFRVECDDRDGCTERTGWHYVEYDAHAEWDRRRSDTVPF